MVRIYAERISPRLRYLLEVLFGHWYGTAYELVPHPPGSSSTAEGARIYYVDQVPGGAPAGLHIRPSGWLNEGVLPPEPSGVATVEGLPAFPLTPGGSGAAPGLPFDLFALLFHQLSRMEEYLPGPRDTHGRFPARASLAYRHGFLERPLADLWANRLMGRLKAATPRWHVQQPPYCLQPTVDVDYPWAFHYKPLWRQAAAFLKNTFRHPALARRHWEVWRGRAEDPFFTFPYLHRQLAGHAGRFFILMGGKTAFDKGPPPGLPPFWQLIATLGDHLGIHPSYASPEEPELLAIEKKRLETLWGRPVLHSRQHYLRMRLPDTYRQLLAAGIRHDWTMGYAEAVGFRAGTARSFPWYDLEREHTTELIIHPFVCMDVSLRNYLELSPQEAARKGRELARSTQEAGGTFTFIWHNSSFSAAHGWSGWRETFEQLLSLKG